MHGLDVSKASDLVAAELIADLAVSVPVAVYALVEGCPSIGAACPVPCIPVCGNTVVVGSVPVGLAVLCPGVPGVQVAALHVGAVPVSLDVVAVSVCIHAGLKAPRAYARRKHWRTGHGYSRNH